jgi:hypothetical protein
LLVTFTEGDHSGKARSAGKPTLLRRGFFRMTDELMLFLALAGGFTVVLVEWWARQTP